MTKDVFETHRSDLNGRTVAVFPATPAQRRIWADSIRFRECGAANASMRWRIEGTMSQTTVENALNHLINRYEILRTAFAGTDGALVQLVKDTAKIRVREIDLALLAEGERQTHADTIAQNEARSPMSLTMAPLIRATVLRFGPDHSELLLTFHGMIVDAWSIGILIREFRSLALALERAEPYTLAPVDLQFGDYALWQEEMLASSAFDASRSFWRQHLRHAGATKIAGDKPGRPERRSQSQIQSILLPRALSDNVEEFARRRGVTLYAMAVAALAMMFNRVSRQADIVIGSQVACRQERAAETVVGPLVNSVTLRLKASDNDRLDAVLERTNRIIQTTLEHQVLPIEAVALGGKGERDATKLHAVNVVVQRAYSDVADLQDTDSAPFKMIALPSHSTGALWDLNFFMVGRRHEGWRMSCEANTDLYEANTVDGLLHAWRQCLEALTASPHDVLGNCKPLQEIKSRSQAPATVHFKPARKIIGAGDPASHVVRFNAQGTRTPVIAVNNGFALYQLAEALGPDRPFIDVQLLPLHEPIELPRRAFEDYAADAVRIIRWAQPRGPYILCGFCVYGAAAFEAARQLQAAGEEVLLVSIFDSWAPGYRETMPVHDKWLRTLQLRGRDYARRLKQFERGELSVDDIVWRPIGRRLGLTSPPPPTPPTPTDWYDEYLRSAVTEYRPKPFDGDVLAFRSVDPLRGRLFDHRMGWTSLVDGDLQTIDVPAAHLEMFRAESAHIIARHMRETLRQLEGR